MPRLDYNQWAAEAGVISRTLRGLADRWDAALTDEHPELLPDIADEVGDVVIEIKDALYDMPDTPMDAAGRAADAAEILYGDR